MNAFDLDPNLFLPVFNGLLRLFRLRRRRLRRQACRDNPRPLVPDSGCRA